MKTTPALKEAGQLLARYESDPRHVRQVCKLSRTLWRDSQSLHALDKHSLVLLEIAALLHDTGWSRAADGRAHHKHSAEIIRSHPWRNLPKQEVELIAQTARYHRKSPPHNSHRAFAVLNRDEQHLVSALGALLRLADALDRSHAQPVKRVTLQPSTPGWILKIDASSPLTEEKYGFSKKKDWFEVYFQTKITLDCINTDFS